MSRLQKLLGVGKGYLERLPPVDVHKLLRIILLNLPYIMIFMWEISWHGCINTVQVIP